jgi:phosphoenolpyruvate mutase
LSRSSVLRECLTSRHLDFLMEAHNALSARIVQESGFKAIWASGLTISTSLGVRDSNEVSWTQVLEILEFMADSTTIPILLDGDTGYGNFNNVRRLVKKLCQRNISGVCIEDKIFPKTNSFIGDNQPLANIEEFCGKLKAAKDSQTDIDFTVVARVEALISGAGVEEALKRATAYYRAGADAILIHSKRSTADEVLEFAARCPREIPLVIVPTKYYKTPTNVFRESNISAIIWANHNLRACISTMKKICSLIQKEESIHKVEHEIATLDEIFSLFDYEELSKSEEKYLPNV